MYIGNPLISRGLLLPVASAFQFGSGLTTFMAERASLAGEVASPSMIGGGAFAESRYEQSDPSVMEAFSQQRGVQHSPFAARMNGYQCNKDMPAEAAGLLPGDVIISVGDGVERRYLRQANKMLDADGNVICTLIMKLDPNVERRKVVLLDEQEIAFSARRLLGYVLQKRVAGRTITLDLLERFNKFEVPVYVPLDEYDEHGWYSFRNNEVAISPMQDGPSPKSAFALLHELMHAWQFNREDRPLSEDSFNRERYLKKLLEHMESQLTPSGILHHQSWLIYSACRHLDLLQKGLSRVCAKRMDAIKKDLQDLRMEFETLPREGDAELSSRLRNMKDVLSLIRDEVLHMAVLPGIRMEREADAGALRALRTIRAETGIDLFVPYLDDELQKVTMAYRKAYERSPSIDALQRSIQQGTGFTKEMSEKMINAAIHGTPYVSSISEWVRFHCNIIEAWAFEVRRRVPGKDTMADQSR
jgi:hypothetical protein